MDYKVYAIKYSDEKDVDRVVAVSAELEYGAVKRLCSDRLVKIIAVQEMESREVEHSQRRIEGCCSFEFNNEAYLWEYH